jgi:hypothetical protein
MDFLDKRSTVQNVNMRFRTLHIMSLYRAGSLLEFRGNYPDIGEILWECRRSDLGAVAPNKQKNTHFVWREE